MIALLYCPILKWILPILTFNLPALLNILFLVITCEKRVINMAIKLRREYFPSLTAYVLSASVYISLLSYWLARLNRTLKVRSRL